MNYKLGRLRKIEFNDGEKGIGVSQSWIAKLFGKDVIISKIEFERITKK